MNLQPLSGPGDRAVAADVAICSPCVCGAHGAWPSRARPRCGWRGLFEHTPGRGFRGPRQRRASTGLGAAPRHGCPAACGSVVAAAGVRAAQGARQVGRRDRRRGELPPTRGW